MAILLAAGGAGYWWWKTNAAPASEDAARKGGASGDAQGGRRFAGAKGAQPVSVQAARRQDIGVTVNAIGAIAAWNTATVHAQVSGVLQKLNFTEGRQVKAGEVLALIDPRAFEASLGQADGALSRDKAQLDNARVDLKRYQDLFARDAVARQQLDTQEALVRQLEGTVKLDQSAVDTARLQLSYTRVSAPIAGKAGLKQVDLGNVVQPTDINGIVIITQTRPIALVFSVPAGNLPQITARLKTGKPLPVEAWDRSGAVRLAAGRVATVDNAIDASTDTIRIKAMFENADDALYPNQAVSVRLRLDTLVGAIAVPQAAVQRGAQGFYVYVVNSGNSVSPRVVVPGAVDGEWMAVTGQLQPGETVVIDGVDRLRDGARVEVIAADPKARAGANASRGAGPRPGSTAKGERGKPEGKAQRGRDLPPDVAEKVKLMSPDERRAWFGKQRETQTEPGAPH